MSNQQHRRDFLRNAALVTAGALGGVGNGLFPTQSHAIEPIQRIGKPKFKFSLVGYSYRSLLTGNPPKMTLEDFATDAPRWAWRPPSPPPTISPESHARVPAEVQGPCLPPRARHLRHGRGERLLPPRPGARKQQIALVKKWIEHAEVLCAPVIRIFSGSKRPNQTLDEAHRLAVEGIEECCDYAGQHGVLLALENHGGLTTEVAGILRLIRDVKSPWFGVNFDSGNFGGADPYGDLAKIAPYTINTHIKVSLDRRQADPADYRRLAKILGTRATAATSPWNSRKTKTRGWRARERRRRYARRLGDEGVTG